MESETSVNSRSQERFQTKAVLLLSISHFIHDVYSGFLSPLLPLLIEKLSLSLTRAGLLSTVMQIPSLLNPVIGLWADRISMRWFIIMAPSLTAVPMSLIGLAPSYAMLLILLLVTGVSVSLFHVPAPVMVAGVSGIHTGRGMSLYMTGGELARAVAPLAAIGAVTLLGLEGLYPLMVFGLASSLWLFIAFKDVPSRQSKTSAPLTLRDTWVEMRHILLPLIAILVARGFMHAALTTFLPTFINQQSGNLWLAGISLTLVETAGVAGVLSAGSLSDGLGRRRVLLFSLVGAPLMLLCFIWVDSWVRFGILAITGFALLSTTPVMLAIVQENSKSSPSTSNGIFIMSSFMARSSVTVIVGFLGDLIGLKATFTLSAFLGLGGIPFILMLPQGNIKGRGDRRIKR